MDAKLFLFWFHRFLFRFNVVIISNQFPTHIYLPHNMLTNWSQGTITLIVLQKFWKRVIERENDRWEERGKGERETYWQAGRTHQKLPADQMPKQWLLCLKYAYIYITKLVLNMLWSCQKKIVVDSKILIQLILCLFY